MSDAVSLRSVTSIRDAVKDGRVKVVEVVDHVLAAIRGADSQVHAFLDVFEDEARERAEELDRTSRDDGAPRRLLGVPIALKDNICVSGRPTTAGSRVLKDYRPPYNAHVVDRLVAEGAVLIGKTNLDEFGFGSSTENSAYGATLNPHDLTRVPGGSSGGSAAAVAAGMVPAALGSDTGGSIRQPASLCGVCGFKPTYGSVSRRGLIAFASSLDQIGPLGLSVLDVALVQSVISGFDPGDPSSLSMESRDYVPTLSKDLDGLRVGVHRELVDEIANTEVRGAVLRAIETLRDAGARIVRLDDIDLMTAHAVSAYYLIAAPEASSNLSRYDGLRYGPRADAPDLNQTYQRTRGDYLGDEAKRRILLGTFALSAGHYDDYYAKAIQMRARFRAAYDKVFQKVDVLVGATSPVPAFPIGENCEDPLAMYQFDAFTIPASLARLPAASVPCGTTKDGLPIGLQIVGARGRDAAVLSFAFGYEQQRGFKVQPVDLIAKTTEMDQA